MKKIAILVASIMITCSINTKVFAVGAEKNTNTVTSVLVTEKKAVNAETGEGSTDIVEKQNDEQNMKENGENDLDVIIQEAGVLPDSILYSFDKVIDDIMIFLTFDDEKKIEMISKVIDERLAESQVMTEQEKLELAEEVLKEFNEKMIELSDKMNEAIEEDEEVLEELEETVKENEEELEEDNSENGKIENIEKNEEEIDSEELNDLEEEILNKQEITLEILKYLEGKFNNESKEVINEVIEMQLAKKEAVANMVEKRHELNAARKHYNMAKVKLKKINKTYDDDLIAEAEQELLEARENYEIFNEEYKRAFKEKKRVDEEVKNKYRDKNEEIDNDEVSEEVENTEENQEINEENEQISNEHNEDEITNVENSEQLDDSGEENSEELIDEEIDKEIDNDEDDDDEDEEDENSEQKQVKERRKKGGKKIIERDKKYKKYKVKTRNR